MAPRHKLSASSDFALSLESIDLHGSLLGKDDPHLTALIEGAEPESEQSADTRYRDVIVPLLELLPAKEADMIEMYFVRRMREVDIAAFFECTQAAVSYLLQRAVKRLRFLVALPQIPDDEVAALLKSTDLEPMDIAVLLDYRTTTQQVATARNLGLTQGRVRHLIQRSCRHLERLTETRPELRDLTRMMCAYRDNPNILRRVELPQWAHKGEMARDDRYA